MLAVPAIWVMASIESVRRLNVQQLFCLMGRVSVPSVLLIQMNPMPCLCGRATTLERNFLNLDSCLRAGERKESEHPPPSAQRQQPHPTRDHNKDKQKKQEKEEAARSFAERSEKDKQLNSCCRCGTGTDCTGRKDTCPSKSLPREKWPVFQQAKKLKAMQAKNVQQHAQLQELQSAQSGAS